MSAVLNGDSFRGNEAYDVAIVGCGPVGALAANLCGRAGLRTVVIERELQPHPQPRAVHIDHEMMRLFQAAGVIDLVAPDMRETDGNLHVGASSQVIRYLGTAGGPRPFGWANDYFFYQPELEAHLRSALIGYPHVSMRLGTNFESIAQSADKVTLTLTDMGRPVTVRARWVIACDGASSPVRKSLGIRLDDLDFEEPWLVVDAEVDGPVQFPELSGLPDGVDLQKLSVMLCDPRRPTTVVPGRGSHRRWEFMLLPGEDENEIVRPENLAALIKPWLGGVSHRITRASTYRFHGLIAEKWQVGNVFLAGDAAHQTPPFFGQGMCHGFRDVASLSWKMALVRSGSAHPRLLDTYQPAREQQVRRIISAAVEAGRYICILDVDAARARDAMMLARARESRLQTAADLIPPITEGVIAPHTAGAGERFIQPWIETAAGSVLLDEITGSGWRVFARDKKIAIQAANEASTVRQIPPVTVTNAAELRDGGAITSWLDERGSLAVIVRPDFYVFGTATTSEALPPLFEQLSGWMAGGRA